MSINNNQHTYQKGFTLVEVAVIMPIAILVIGGLVGAIFAMTNNVLVTRADNNLVFNVQDTLDKIESDIEISSGYLAENNVVIKKGQGEGGGSTSGSGTTTKFTNKDTTTQKLDTLILNSYVTTTNPLSANKEVVYKEDASTTCTTSDTPLMYNVTYFIESGALWRRNIFQSDYPELVNGTDCKPPWQRPSCKELVVDANFCKSKDEKLLTGVTEFNVVYYDTDSNVIPQTNDNAGTRKNFLKDATSIKITISAEGKAGGRTFSESSTIRSSSPNNKFDS